MAETRSKLSVQFRAEAVQQVLETGRAVAHAALSCASDMSMLMTGSTLMVDVRLEYVARALVLVALLVSVTGPLKGFSIPHCPGVSFRGFGGRSCGLRISRPHGRNSMSAGDAARMVAFSGSLDRLTTRLEGSQRLEQPAATVSSLLAHLFPDGVVKDTLSGTWLGHPLHPLLVGVPIGAWTSASLLDLWGGDAQAARRLVGIGLISAGAAVASGGSDFVDTTGAERRVGLVHWAGAWASIGLYATSWWVRGHGRSGRWQALAGAGVLSVTGYLGGHLAYALGVGVDTTAFESGPEDWTRVAASDEVAAGTSTQVTAEGVAILLARHDGRLSAMADRCTHRGAPLSDGDIADGCVVCPWHNSAFSLDDGRVIRGPATRPQPSYEVKDEGGAIFVRRAESRALRANPV